MFLAKNKNKGALRSIFKKSKIYFVNVIHVVFFPVNYLPKVKRARGFL